MLYIADVVEIYVLWLFQIIRIR